jgi:branched-chain amino acid aminotransferase
MIGSHIIKNGTLLPVEEAHLQLDDIAALYGFGVYESLRVKNGRIFFLEKHIARLLHSAALIGLEHCFNAGTIQSWCTTLIEKNNTKTANIKIIFLGGKEPTIYIFLLAPKFVEKKEYREGVAVTTFHYERFLPQAKTLNMLASYMAYTDAKKQKAFDALFIDKNNNIIEGSRSNFFAIKGNILYSPPTTHILAGITREHVIDCAMKNDFIIEEKNILLEDIFNYDGAFLTNTSSKIVPIRKIDDTSFEKIPEELQRLRTQYNQYLKTI